MTRRPDAVRSQPWETLADARIVDLAQPLEHGIPVSPNHPGFRLALVRRHGDMMREDGTSAANELLVLGGHTGTHVDAFSHFSWRGQLHGGDDAAEAQRGGRFSVHGVDAIPPFIGRGVVLDVPSAKQRDVLPAGTPITAGDLEAAAERQGIEVSEGDAVLVHTGWAANWGDPSTYVGLTNGTPGVDESGGAWLVERGARLVGSDTLAFEVVRPGLGHSVFPVHKMLLVDAGIHIVEMLNLVPLVADEISEFLLIMVPLNVVGATGVPVRPLAIVAGASA